MKQFVLDLPTADPYKLDDFIISNSNKAVYNLIINFKTFFGVNPFNRTLLVQGPKSCGKTFLTKIFQNQSGAYLISKSQKPLFADVLQNFHAFVIDDIEVLSEGDLLYYFNIINENNKYLLLTQTAKKIDFKIKDLNSRINSIFKAELLPPDVELIKILLFKIFSTYSINPTPKILNFLISRLPRDFDEIIKFAKKIILHSHQINKKISIPLIKDVQSIYTE